MPDRPPRIPREEPESTPPPKREEHRPVFVTRNELGFALSQLKREIVAMLPAEVGRELETKIAPVKSSLQRLEEAATAQRLYNEERARRRQEEKEDLELDIIRAKLDSQNDERELIKAKTDRERRHHSPQPMPSVVIQNPPTSPPFEVPHAIDGSRNKRIAIVTVIITTLGAIIVAAIGAWSSQHSSPRGVVEPVPIVAPH